MAGRAKRGVTNPYEGAGIINITAAVNPQTVKLFDIKRSIYDVALKPEALLNVSQHYPLVWLSTGLDHQIPNLDPGATRPVQVVGTLNGLLSRHMEENAEDAITTTRDAYLEHARILDRLNFAGVSMGTLNCKDFEGARNSLENSNFMLASTVQGIVSVTHASEEILQFGDAVMLTIPKPEPRTAGQELAMPKPVDFRRQEADRYIPHLTRWDPMLDFKSYDHKRTYEDEGDMDMLVDEDEQSDIIIALPEPLVAALETARHYVSIEQDGRAPAGMPNNLECLVRAATHLKIFDFQDESSIIIILTALVDIYKAALDESSSEVRPHTDLLCKFGSAMLAFQALQYCSERRVIGMAVNSNPNDGSADLILR